MKKILLAFIIVASLFLFVSSVKAQFAVEEPSSTPAVPESETPKSSPDTGNRTPQTVSGVIKLENPLKNTEGGLVGLFGFVIGKAMGFLGSLALAAFMIGGFWWLISAGNAETVKKGTSTMLWAVIGLFVIFSSYAILSLVLKAFTGNGGAGTVLDQNWKKCGDKSGWACTEITKCKGMDLSKAKENADKRAVCKATPGVCVLEKCNEKGQGDSVICCKTAGNN